MKPYIRNRTEEQKAFCKEGLFGRERGAKRPRKFIIKFDPIHNTVIRNSKEGFTYKRNISGNYEAVSFGSSPYGIIKISELDWENNFGRDVFTRLELIKNKKSYSAWIDIARLDPNTKKEICKKFIDHFKFRLIENIKETQTTP